MTATSRRDERMDPDLLDQISAVVRVDDKVATLSRGKPNTIVALGAEGVWVETERSAEADGPRLVPAWMFNEAWGVLCTEGEVRNPELIKTVKRSSAVMAILAELPQVRVVSTRPIVLRL